MSRPASLVGPAIAAVVTFALGRAALLPGVAFWDTAEFQTVGPILGTAHPPGYPSYVILGWLASIVLQPFGEPAFRMNLLAVVLAAVAASLGTVLVTQLTRRPVLATATGIVFGALPVAWRLATHADPHGLHVALVVLLFVLLLAWEKRGDDRWLVAAAAAFGLALGNHSLTWLVAPGIALFLVAVDPGIPKRPRFVATCAMALALAAGLVYLELPLRAGPFRAELVYGHPETPVGFLYVALGIQFLGGVAPTGDLAARLSDLAGVAATQLGPLAILIPVGLLATAIRRPRYALLTVPSVVLTCWFAASYENAEIDRYYLVPALVAVTWIAVLADGVVELARSLVDRWSSAWTGSRAGARALAVELLAAVAIVAPTMAALPARAVAVDRSGDRAAEEWLDLTLGQVEPNAVVVSWWNFSTPLWYAQLCQGRRLDVRVVDDRTILDERLGGVTDVIDANLGQRPVYLIRQPAELAILEARYRLEHLGAPDYQPLVRVLAPIAAPS